MTWAAIGASAVSAGAGIYGSQQAANAQSDAAKKNAALQQRNMLIQLGLIEPQRQLGYGAMSDLASLYGYNLTPYQTGNQLMNPYAYGGAGNGGTIQVNGRQSSGGYDSWNPLGGSLNPFGFGSKEKRFGGTIDPLTGTVNITNIKNPKKEAKVEAMLSEYVRTGVKPKAGDKSNRFIKEIDRLIASGYQYDPNAAEAARNYSPVGSGQPGEAGGPGNMSRFFTSPDYTFRRDEGQRGIGNSFAARGGAASGNALRALSEFNSNLASSEFGNYTNRLLRMAGFGESANNQASNAATNYTNGMSQSNTQQGDARASGVLGTTNSVMGLMGDFARYWGNRPTNANTGNMGGLDDIPIYRQRIPGY